MAPKQTFKAFLGVRFIHIPTWKIAAVAFAAHQRPMAWPVFQGMNACKHHPARYTLVRGCTFANEIVDNTYILAGWGGLKGIHIHICKHTSHCIIIHYIIVQLHYLQLQLQLYLHYIGIQQMHCITVCTLHFNTKHCIFTTFTPHLHYTYITCSLHLHYIYTTFTLRTFTIHLQYIYICITCPLQLHYSHITLALHLLYICTTFILRLRYILITFTLHLHCIYTTSTFTLHLVSFTFHLYYMYTTFTLSYIALHCITTCV